MNESFVEKINQKTRKPFKTCYKCYQIQEGIIDGEIPESCNDCENFNDMIEVSQVLKSLSDCVVISKEELQEIYDDDVNYISKKDLIKKMLGGKKENGCC